MTIYHSLDEGIPSEVQVYDLPDRRPEAHPFAVPVPSFSPDGIAARKAQPADEPFAATFRWVASLPRDVRPLAVLRHYPRIANVLALSWSEPAVVREYLFDLLIDRRGRREGFSADVRAELLVLRAYLDDCNVHAATRVAHGGL